MWERIWRTILALLDSQGKLDWEAAFLDGSLVPVKREDLRLARPSAVRGTKWMLIVDGSGIIVGFHLDIASKAELRLADPPPRPFSCSDLPSRRFWSTAASSWAHCSCSRLPGQLPKARLRVIPLRQGGSASVFDAALPEVSAKTQNISTEELRRPLSDGSTLVLDTRPYREYALSHIPGALNVAPKPGMPMAQSTSDVAEIERLTQRDRTRPLVLSCDGPFRGKSKRVAEDLLAAGFQNVRRYQWGAPVWRALGNPMVVEADGARHVFENDRTAYFIDARSPETFRTGSIPGAKNICIGQFDAAKDDGRLPMEDHNTRIIVFGADAEQARTVAEELARKAAFHNVAYIAGPFEVLRAALQ